MQLFTTRALLRVLLALAAGGPIDTIARALGDAMQTILGQPIVVENKPGAGGTLGVKAAEAAGGDGDRGAAGRPGGAPGRREGPVSRGTR